MKVVDSVRLWGDFKMFTSHKGRDRPKENRKKGTGKDETEEERGKATMKTESKKI